MEQGSSLGHRSPLYSSLTIRRCNQLTQPYIIRPAEPGDIDALVQLEEESWAAPLQASRANILDGVTNSWHNDFVLELCDANGAASGRILAAMFTQFIESIGEIERVQSVTNVRSIRSDSGRVLQLLRVNTLLKSGGDWLGVAPGAALRNFGLRYAQNMGLSTVCAVTRCTNFAGSSASNDLLTYVSLRDEQGLTLDRGLNFHVACGAVIVSCISGWRPQDASNNDYGVLVEYSINEPSDSGKDEQQHRVLGADVTFDYIQAVIRRTVKKIAGDSCSDFHLPFMLVGVDSLGSTQMIRCLGT